jgi:hypothetical protein
MEPTEQYPRGVSSPALSCATGENVSAVRYIYVRSGTRDLLWGNLLPILECFLPAKFTFTRPEEFEAAGEIIVDDTVGGDSSCSSRTVSSITIPRTQTTVGELKLTETGIKFADDPAVPFPFRARSLRSNVPSEGSRLSLKEDEKVLASDADGPIWAVSREAGAKHFRSSFAFPGVPPNGNLRDVLNGERFLEMLPLLQWLRENCAGSLYEQSPLRACFIIDDPNLHWPRYGFVDYSHIAARAAKENYHVAFATVPLDAWYTHQATAEIFRTNASRLSLCVHGNNHTKKELSRYRSQLQRESLLNQALHRIARLERSAGVKVCRVMVPPHGACSEAMLGELPRCGFEAACISHGSLQAHNGEKPWIMNLGFLPSELIRGCPVMPRWGLSGKIANSILLAVFLGQAVILRGHHQDLRDGIELLDQVAGFINGLGVVVWQNMTQMSRSSYLWRMDGTTCRLRPLARKVTFPIPSEATSWVLEVPPGSGVEAWQVSGEVPCPPVVRAGEQVQVAGSFKSSLFVQADERSNVPVETGSHPHVGIAFLRRLLTEGRDRVRPLVGP